MDHLVIDEKVDFGMEEVIGCFRLRGGVFELVLGSHQKRDELWLSDVQESCKLRQWHCGVQLEVPSCAG